jgi:hypothetical protein
MSTRSGLIVTAAAAMVLVAGCATRATSIDARWVNPELVGKSAVTSVLVVSAVRDSTNRRLFEDQMVAALAAAGLKAEASYKRVPEDGPISEDILRRAVSSAGVSHAMVTRIINVSTDVIVTPGMVMGPAWGPGWGYRDPWGPGWAGAASYRNSMWATSVPPQVTVNQNVHADTRLFEAEGATVLWSAATTTAAVSTGSVPAMINQFIEVIVSTMKEDGVIGSAPRSGADRVNP